MGPAAVNPEYYYNPDNYKNGEIIGYSVMFISMLPVFLGTRAYRNKFFTDTPFTFGKGLVSGLVITLIGTAVFYLGNVLVYEVLQPNFLEEFGVHYKEFMLEQGATQAEKDKILEEFNSMKGMMENGYIYGLLMASSVFLFGLIISLVSATILRRSDVPTDTAEIAVES